MAALSDDEADLMATLSRALVSAVWDTAKWIKPDAITATSMTLVEMAHAQIVAAATLGQEEPARPLDEIIERSHEHLKLMTRFYYDRVTERTGG
jgi:hypothetical protein